MTINLTTPLRQENAVLAPIVGAEIQRILLGTTAQGRMKRGGLEFLLSIGMTVKDAGDRIWLLRQVIPYALMSPYPDSDPDFGKKTIIRQLRRAVQSER